MTNSHQNPVIKRMSVSTRSQREVDEIYARLVDQLGDTLYDNIDHLDGVSKAHDLTEFMKGIFLEELPYGRHLSNAESRGVSLIFEQIQELMRAGVDNQLIMGNDIAALTRPDPAAPKEEMN